MTPPFGSHLNFLDPAFTSNGEPYGPHRYKEIVLERYQICKNSNISYSDTGQMTPAERKMILQFIVDDRKREAKALEESKKKYSKKQH